MTVDEFLDAFQDTHQKFPAYMRSGGKIRHADSHGTERSPVVMVTLHQFGGWPPGDENPLFGCARALGLDIWDDYDIEQAANNFCSKRTQNRIRHRMLDIINTPTTEKSNDNSN